MPPAVHSTGPRLTLGPVTVQCSTVDDGDFRPLDLPADVAAQNRQRLIDLPWTMLEQEHGTTVVRVTSPGEHHGAVGDALITHRSQAVLASAVGDCAAVVLVGPAEFAVVHVGWRGLRAGVLDAAIDAFHIPPVVSVVGPLIGSCCYEFDGDAVDTIARALSLEPEHIRATTSWGTAALDMLGAIRQVLSRRALPVEVLGGCTGCTYPGFSHRVRNDAERHVVAAWKR